MTRILKLAGGLLAAGLAVAQANPLVPDSSNTVIRVAPTNDREFYNAGSLQLKNGKLSEAESLLRRALDTSDETVQSSALYNLGHVRFDQGKAELKKCQPPKKIVSEAESFNESGARVMQQAQSALVQNDMQKLIDAYVSARSLRSETRATVEAFNRAMEAHAATLLKWRRSLGDFKSTIQLNPSDTNAVYNAKAVEEAIARLIENIRKMQQAMMPMPGTCNSLKEMISQLKGRIPKEMMPPGAPGGDEEEEIPMLALQGRQEGPSKEGTEMEYMLGPEEAANLLEGLRLDEKQGLPSSRGAEGSPRNRSGNTW